MQPKWLANQLKNVADESMICQRINRELVDELISFRQKTDDSKEHAAAILNQCSDKLLTIKHYLKAEREQNRLRFVESETQSGKCQQALDYNNELSTDIARKRSYWNNELASTNLKINETSERLASVQTKLLQVEQEIRNCEYEVQSAFSALNRCENTVSYQTVTRNGYTESVRVIPDCSSQRASYSNAQSRLSSAQSSYNNYCVQINDLKALLSRLNEYQLQCKSKISLCDDASNFAMESQKKLIQQQKRLNEKKAKLTAIEQLIEQVTSTLKVIEGYHNEQINAKESSDAIHDELITQERVVNNVACNTEADLFIFERCLLERSKQLLEFDRRLFS